MKKRIAIFASGAGSNFEAIADAIDRKKCVAELRMLISDKPESGAVEKAKKRGIEIMVFNPKDYAKKADYEKMICQKLQENSVDLIVLAGYMRLIGPTLLKVFHKRIINIHPSCLPAFRGLDAIGQAIEAKAKKTGVTIHYVDEGMDTGEIIVQKTISIQKNATREAIEAKIHRIEHQLYPKTINKVLEEML